jgi:hypothetical protein
METDGLLVVTVYLTGGSVFPLQYAGLSAPEAVPLSSELSIWRCYCAGSGDLRLCLQLCVHRAILAEREEAGRQCEPCYLAPGGGGCGHLHGEISCPHPYTPRCRLPGRKATWNTPISRLPVNTWQKKQLLPAVTDCGQKAFDGVPQSPDLRKSNWSTLLNKAGKSVGSISTYQTR